MRVRVTPCAPSCFRPSFNGRTLRSERRDRGSNPCGRAKLAMSQDVGESRIPHKMLTPMVKGTVTSPQT
jgi:hypothetical protein